MSKQNVLANGARAFKPPYFEVFELVGGLPPEVTATTCGLLLWIWRHTNTDPANENCGKAWMSQSNLAREMHLGKTTVKTTFNEAEELGLIGREHLFKKNGKVVVSTAPYRRKASKGMGEYIGSRYWVKYDALRKASKKPNGVSDSDTSNESGVANSDTPNPIGLSDFMAGIEIGVSDSATPVSNSDTKGSIEVTNKREERENRETPARPDSPSVTREATCETQELADCVVQVACEVNPRAFFTAKDKAAILKTVLQKNPITHEELRKVVRQVVSYMDDFELHHAGAAIAATLAARIDADRAEQERERNRRDSEKQDTDLARRQAELYRAEQQKEISRLRQEEELAQADGQEI